MADAAISTPPLDPQGAPRRGRRALRWLGRAVAALLVFIILAAAGGGLWVRGRITPSLPELAGERPVAGIAKPVEIARDDLGIPAIRAASRLDAAFATGFVHAQDRFFQMDMMRRQAAGELSGLIGPPVLRLDRTLRIHRFRARAERLLASAPPADRALLEAYARGVNAGLASLSERPFEYLVLGAQPEPWRPEDSFLVQLAMFLSLQDENGEYEGMLGLMQDLLPRPLYDFLTPLGTEWDAPLLGGAAAEAPVPGPEVIDLRRSRKAAALAPVPRPPADLAAGLGFDTGASNAWAVAPSHTATGRPLLAADMHAGLSVPNLWYRTSLSFPSAGGRAIRLVGGTLPGSPLLGVGSNGAVAWAFTNSRIDTSDLVLLEGDPRDPEAYRTPEGSARFERHHEVLRVRGGEEETLEVLWTAWGPVLEPDDRSQRGQRSHRGQRGRRRAIRWVAHEPEAVNLELRRLEDARTVEEALAVAARAGIPAQNFLAVDAAGHIGWTLAGRVPRRQGFDGRTPASWADGGRGWSGWLEPQELPRLVDPPSGRIWSANNRSTGGEILSRLGDGNYVLGARARQIRDRLLRLERATAADMLALQLDDRSLFLDRWQKLLLSVLTPDVTAADPRRRELRRHVEAWGGRAAVGSVGYRLVREFRDTLAAQVFPPLTEACRKADPEFDYAGEIGQAEGPLWKLVTQRPPHLLDPRFRSWDEQLLAAVDAVIEPPSEEGEGEEPPPLAERTWGRRNTAAIGHFFSRSVPLARRWLRMPGDPLPGDDDLPRVQRASYGASQRLVVSPGREEEGFFHMPGGQSGNPLSPHFDDAHGSWVRGEATPFLPGPPANTLTLRPER